ncbi:hypothetical protein SAMN05660328_101321 [Streptococcus gallolyticus]|uniref:Uncharacterized protein n=1 Tax=Streptococcus gallolyticus TaxID=315405 RepID=A0A1I7FCS6_9STRE|nr:DUF5592 family protein [Streptococcus gallolyticus]SFC05646.1 hypothetical protein SAMN02983012_0469 [Streptococcus gallolyticus]SFU34010.1 hypothetical protein SAMN05660328_101321 [Streptococcus gallolyticus]
MTEKYGVPRDIRARIKIIGLFFVDFIFIGASAVAAVTFGMRLFPTNQWAQMIAFILLTPLMCLYLVLPTNGGKKNWHSMVLFFRRRRKRYTSINYQRGGK